MGSLTTAARVRFQLETRTGMKEERPEDLPSGSKECGGLRLLNPRDEGNASLDSSAA